MPAKKPHLEALLCPRTPPLAKRKSTGRVDEQPRGGGAGREENCSAGGGGGHGSPFSQPNPPPWPP